MYDACHRGASAVVDVRHRAGDGSRGRDASEYGREDVGDALSHQFLVGVVMVSDDPVGHRGREQRLDGAQHGDGDGGRHQLFDAFPIQVGHVHARKFGFDEEAVADGFHLRGDAVLFQHIDTGCHDDDGQERAGNLAGELGREGDDGHASHAHACGPQVKAAEMPRVGYPLFDEVGRHFADGQPEKVFHLGGEDGHGDAAGEAHHDGVGDVFDDGAQVEHAEENQEHAGQDGGHEQARFAVLLDDAIDDNDERACRPADLHPAAAEERHGQPGDDGCDDTFFGSHARGDAKGDGQREGHDAHYDAGHDVCGQFLFAVTFQVKEQLRLEFEFCHDIKVLCLCPFLLAGCKDSLFVP